jgi:NADH-quinone oxidoreductase subunit L
MTSEPGFFVRYAWLIPFFPLLGAIVTAVGARRLRSAAHLPAWIGIGLAFLVSLGTLAAAGPDVTYTVMSWLPAGNLDVPIQVRVDGLSTMMLSMVTLVSGLVAIFAAGYMAGDEGYPRFFALIGLFVFSMTGLVLSNNYVLTYVFWEGVGACSYLLVGYWHSRPSASAAAMKAFLVNRVGDFGFAIAIFWLWKIAPGHDLSYDNVFSAAGSFLLHLDDLWWICLLFFWGATAKSAQIPLYVWLPDAMEGPTPVSALIHAATMVTAGVYLIARSTPMIAMVPSVQLIIAIIGCATALLAAAIAVTQNDLKRVMAYSTVSQLGYMFMALGAGIGDVARLAVVAAMFHLFTHAFFKALLFLASGSVMHAMGDVIDMRRFRGLRHRLPITCWTFAVGGLALAAIPPLSGFFSKDEVLGALSGASHAAHEHGWGWIYGAIYWLAILTAFLTAFYTGRAFFMTFFGPEKLPSPDDPEAPPTVPEDAHSHAHPEAEGAHVHSDHHEIGHESPPIMWIPLVALAGCTVLIGLICLAAWPFTGGPAEWFAHHLEKTLAFESIGHGEHGFSWLTAIIGTLVGVGGIGLSYLMYAESSPLPTRLMERFRPLYEQSLHKFYIDEIYDWVVVRPLRGLARFSDWLDENLVDKLVRGIAEVPRAIARARLARYQNGLIQFYAAASAMSVALLLLALMTDVTVVLGLIVVLVIVLYVGSRLRPAAAREPMRVGRAEGDV